MKPLLRSLLLFGAVAHLLAAPPAWSQTSAPNDLGIDHRYTNIDAQSLIGLTVGSHKTTAEKNGSLRWSQWSLKRRPLDSPIGFSSQMDGMLAIEPSVAMGESETALKPGAHPAAFDFTFAPSSAGGATP